MVLQVRADRGGEEGGGEKGEQHQLVAVRGYCQGMEANVGRIWGQGGGGGCVSAAQNQSIRLFEMRIVRPAPQRKRRVSANFVHQLKPQATTGRVNQAYLPVLRVDASTFTSWEEALSTCKHAGCKSAKISKIDAFPPIANYLAGFSQTAAWR